MVRKNLETNELNANSCLEGEEWALIQRIVASPAFVRSPFLTKFLLYICDRKLHGREEEITEYQIGIHALGRPSSFHTGEDNIVRNYARLLRRNLTEYFENEGSQEEITVEIPKGHYRPVFQRRSKPATLSSPAAGSDSVSGSDSVRQGGRNHHKRLILWLIVSLVFATFLAAGTWLGIRSHRTQSDAAIGRFWGPFWSGDAPLVIFSNAVFLGDSKNGMHVVPFLDDRPRTGAAEYTDTYTGIGEVNGVFQLTRLFDSHHATFTLKRSLLVTWDEARRRNLIFIGAASENLALRDLPSSTDFTLVTGNGFSGFSNLHPRPGESALYSRIEHPLTLDYAVLALMPGLEPDRKVLIFSGLTTFGTQAAVEFTCSPEGAKQLMQAVAGPRGTIRPFEAVIETKVTGGVPVQSKLVAVHVH